MFVAGYSSRYAYCPVMGDFGQGPKFKGIAKLDLHAPAGKTLVAELSFGKLRGGEAFFVPASPDLTQLRGMPLHLSIAFAGDSSIL